MTARLPLLLLAAALVALALLPAATGGQPPDAATPPRAAGGLELLAVELPDGVTWILGPAGGGAPFVVRLRLANRGTVPLRIWDPRNSEGSGAPSVVLTDAEGRRTELRPPPFERSGGPSFWTIAPGQVRAIALDLTALLGERPLAPGRYTVRPGYDNALPAVGGMRGVWTGRLAGPPRPIVVVLTRGAPPRDETRR